MNKQLKSLIHGEHRETNLSIFSRILFLYLIGFISFFTTVVFDSISQDLTATYTDQPIELDGVLKEDIWSKANPVSNLVQIQPDQGQPASLLTKVYIVYNSESIYFGFTCYDSKIDQLVSNEMRRDGSNIHENDNVFVLIDSYNDRRDGFFFRVNPLGALQDARVFKNGDSLNFDWDAVWNARTKINKTNDEEGFWVAEICIPFSQLRFEPKDINEWGLNVGREIARLHEEAILVPVPKKYGSKAKYRTQNLAVLSGLTLISPTRKFEVLPYLTSGVSLVNQQEKKNNKPNRILELGGDFKYSLTPNLTFDATYNTDFAQVEADQEYINLTRYSTFFPEKRPFFLEGSNFFEFSIPQATLSKAPPLLLFYSRRIGIEQGQMIPIVGGSKVTGKVGDYGIGLLHVLSSEMMTTPSEITIPSTNFSVFRIRRDILSSSNFGFITTNRQSSKDMFNRTIGLDLNYRPTETITVNSLFASSLDVNRENETSPSEQSGLAYALAGGWRSDSWRASIGYSGIDPEFKPGIGFAERGGGQRLRGEFRWSPWVKDVGGWLGPILKIMNLKEMFSGPETDISLNSEYQPETIIFRYLHWMNFVSNDWLAIDVRRTLDRLEQPFKVHRDHEIPPDQYFYTNCWLTTQTDQTRSVSARVSAGFGQYYNGKRSGLNGFMRFKPSNSFTLESSYSLNRVKLPTGSFDANVIDTRVVYAVSTTAYIKLFTQWNSGNQLISTNLLINYIYQPGSNFYLVLNQVYDLTLPPALRFTDRALLAKLTFWYQ